MEREGEGVGREEQDETRHGRAELKCGGKAFLSVLRSRTIHIPASPCPLSDDNEFRRVDLHTVYATDLCIGMRLLLCSHNPTKDNV